MYGWGIAADRQSAKPSNGHHWLDHLTVDPAILGPGKESDVFGQTRVIEQVPLPHPLDQFDALAFPKPPGRDHARADGIHADHAAAQGIGVSRLVFHTSELPGISSASPIAALRVRNLLHAVRCRPEEAA